MNQTESIWTFGELRAFFHDGQPHTEARFHQLIHAIDQAWRAHPDEVETQWIPYAIEMLARWPHHVRTPPTDDSPFDEPYGEHPLYELVACERFEFLGLSWRGEENMDDMLRYARQASVEGLVSFELDTMDDVTQAQLAEILAGLSRAPLKHLGLTYMEVDDQWIPTIKAAPLPDLQFFDISGQQLSPAGILDLAQTPYLRHLRHMHFDDIPNTHTPDVQIQIKLMDALPNLITTLAPHNARPWYEIKDTWQEEAQPPTKSVQARVEAALAIYRQQDDTEYPFLGSSFGCFGQLIEVSDDLFDDPEATLADVFDDYEDIAQDEDMGITTIYVLATRQGALEGAFDQEGNLITTLTFRAFGHSWKGGPGGREEGYNGEYFAQSWFAKWQLFLAFGEHNTLRLTPHPPEHSPDLLRFMQAIDAAGDWVGGWHLDYYCSPWLEPLNGTEFSVDMRCMIAWEEEEHAFDQRGQLSDAGQEMIIRGDAVPLLRVLRDFGFVAAQGYGNKVLIKRA